MRNENQPKKILCSILCNVQNSAHHSAQDKALKCLISFPHCDLNETALTNKLLINDEKSTIFTSFFSSSILSTFHRMKWIEEWKKHLYFYFSCAKSHHTGLMMIIFCFFFFFCSLISLESQYRYDCVVMIPNSKLNTQRAVCAVFYIFWTFIIYFITTSLGLSSFDGMKYLIAEYWIFGECDDNWCYCNRQNSKHHPKPNMQLKEEYFEISMCRRVNEIPLFHSSLSLFLSFFLDRSFSIYRFTYSIVDYITSW